MTPVLTPRQRAVVQGIVNGETYEEIAARLGIAERTVRMHVQRIAKRYPQTPGSPLRRVRRHALQMLAA